MAEIFEFLRNLNVDPSVSNALTCVLLCIGGAILIIVFSIVGNILGVFLEFIELFFEVLSAGPVASCGCFILIFVCIGIVALVLLSAAFLPGCGTPDAVRLCSLLGR